MPLNYKNPVLNLIIAIVLITLFFIHPVNFLTVLVVLAILGIIWKSIFLRSWAITIGLFLAILAILLLPHAP